MKIKRVEHVAIACRNMSDSMKMLESIFGFEKELEETIGTTNLAMYPVGETYIELLESSNPKSKIAELIKEKNQKTEKQQRVLVGPKKLKIMLNIFTYPMQVKKMEKVYNLEMVIIILCII